MLVSSPRIVRRKDWFSGFCLVLQAYLFLAFLGCAETARQTTRNSSSENAESGRSIPHQSSKKESGSKKQPEDDAHTVSNAPKAKNKDKLDNSTKKESTLVQEAAALETQPADPPKKTTKKDSGQARIGVESGDEKVLEKGTLSSSPPQVLKELVSEDSKVSTSNLPKQPLNGKKIIPDNAEQGSESITKKDSVPFSESLSVEEALSTADEADQVHGNLPPEKARQGKRASKALDAVRKSDLQENSTASSISEVESFFTPKSDQEKRKLDSESPSQDLSFRDSEDQTSSSAGEPSPVLETKVERIKSDGSVTSGTLNPNTLELEFSSPHKNQSGPIKKNMHKSLGYSAKSDGLEAGLKDPKAKTLGWRTVPNQDESENQESVSRALVESPSKPAYLRLQEFIQTSSPNDFSSKKEDREYSKISVWAEGQPDRNRTSVDALRSQEKRFGKALQWIRDKGRKQMDEPSDED